MSKVTDMKRIFFLILISFFTTVAQEQNIVKKGDVYYLSHTIVVKFKSEYSTPSSFQLLKRANLLKIGITDMNPLFPNVSKFNKGEEGLSRVYLLKFNSSEDPFEIARKLSKSSELEWAEPKYVQQFMDIPNDSIYKAGSQRNLKIVEAEKAWEITKGEPSIIIGIVDSGVQWDHPDLYKNIWHNPHWQTDTDFPNDSIGWDFGGVNGIPDNDPREDPSPHYHGTHVAGIAGAVTNNKIGIASIGYNCKIMPVKVSPKGSPFALYGYEGIKYAVDNGARIINCSWGSYSSSRFEQEVIDYATSKGALVVASAGNEPTVRPVYPASYRNVLSVGWSNDDDTWFWGSNYGKTICVLAPGTDIISTYPGNSYQILSGTSMSAPLVSGLAGLVATRFKNFTPLQIREQIRATSDDVYNINPSRVKYLLGKGRINAFRAVTDTNVISIRAENVKYIVEGNPNELPESGDEVSIEINFTNYLHSINNVSVSLQTKDSSVVILNPSFDTGHLVTLSSVSNQSDKFRFKIKSNAPSDHDVDFLMIYSGQGYSDFQWISVRINQNYCTEDMNKIALTITSKGALGFNDYPSNNEGVGLVYLNRDNVLNEGAFMYGTGPDKLMNAARVKATQSTDFKTIKPLRIFTPGLTADQEGLTVFNDDGAGISRMGITTEMKTYSYAKAPNDRYIILQTRLENTTQQNINNLFVGYFFDLNISTGYFADDIVQYDFTDNFCYTYSKSGITQNAYFGVALISSDKYGFYAIDEKNPAGDVVLNDSNGFTDLEKWFALSNGIKSTIAGPSDVSFVISGGPFSIATNNYIDVAFAIAGGSNIEEVREAIKQSRIKYNEIITNVEEGKSMKPTEFALYQNYPNPFNPLTVIKFQVPEKRNITLKVFNILGEEVTTLADQEKEAGIYEVKFDGSNLASGVYFCRLQAGDFSQTKKIILLK